MNRVSSCMDSGRMPLLDSALQQGNSCGSFLDRRSWTCAKKRTRRFQMGTGRGFVEAVFFSLPLTLSVGCGAQIDSEPESNTEDTPALTGSVDLHPTKDAYVRSGSYADTNYGTATELILK